MIVACCWGNAFCCADSQLSKNCVARAGHAAIVNAFSNQSKAKFFYPVIHERQQSRMASRKRNVLFLLAEAGFPEPILAGLYRHTNSPVQTGTKESLQNPLPLLRILQQHDGAHRHVGRSSPATSAQG